MRSREYGRSFRRALALICGAAGDHERRLLRDEPARHGRVGGLSTRLHRMPDEALARALRRANPLCACGVILGVHPMSQVGSLCGMANAIDDSAAVAGGDWTVRIDGYVQRACDAADALRKLDQEAVDRIVWEMTVVGLENAVELAELAMEETHFGVLEDKVLKNYIATEFLYDYLKDKKSVGVVDEDRERAIQYVAEPIGVVLALLPITNPTSTALFKSIVGTKTRNAMIMRPSAAAARCAMQAVELLQAAGEAAGLPPNSLQVIPDPTLDVSQYLFHHPGVDFIWTTGGPKAVAAAKRPPVGMLTTIRVANIPTGATTTIVDQIQRLTKETMCSRSSDTVSRQRCACGCDLATSRPMRWRRGRSPRTGASRCRSWVSRASISARSRGSRPARRTRCCSRRCPPTSSRSASIRSSPRS
jgi:hypothetical protein